MLKLRRYLAGFERECVLAPLFKLLEATFQLLVPIVMASIVDDGIAQGDRNHVLVCAAALVAMGIAGWIFAVIAQYFSARLCTGFGTALRDDLFRHVMSLSRSDVDKLGTSTLMTRITNDSNQIQDGVGLFFRLVLRCPISVFGATALAFVIDGWEGAVFCVVAALVLALVWAVMRVAVRRYRDVQRRLDDVTRATSENLEGVRVLRAFGRENTECIAFDETVAHLRKGQVHAGDVSALMNPLSYVTVNLGLVAVLATGGAHVDVGTLTQGQVVALVNYMSQMLVEVLKLANLVIVLSKAEACARRVNEVFARTPSMEDGTERVDDAAPTVEFRDVSFTYPGAGAPALSHVSFYVGAGQTLGIIGGTGSGKSTLASLVMRFYDVSTGEVLVGGRDVRTYQRESLHSLVGLVDQRPRLFAGTIESNLRWGAPDADAAELASYVATAQARDVVASKGGLSGDVEQLGRNFSGGQRQRLSIARTLARRPRILILDDAFSALDLATDAALRHALRQTQKGVTQLLISQRVSAIRTADCILVLDDGHLVGSGTHQELLRSCAVYQEICASQPGGKEALA